MDTSSCRKVAGRGALLTGGLGLVLRSFAGRVTERELEALHRRAAELAEVDEPTDDVVEVNTRILEIDPADRDATNRLGITYIDREEWPEARDVFERGLEANPNNAVGRRRLERDVMPKLEEIETSSQRRSPEDIVEPVLAGPGRDQCVRFFAASIREIQRIDGQLLAVYDIPPRRFRVMGGILSACSPYQGMLLVSIDRRAAASLIAEVERLGGRVVSEGNQGSALPFTDELAVPVTEVDAVWEPLWTAHHQHLRESIDYGASGHLGRHRPDLLKYLLDEADKLHE